LTLIGPLSGMLQGKFYSVQAGWHSVDQDGRANQAHPAVFVYGGADFDVNGETAPVFNGICAQLFHLGPRLLAVQRNGVVPTNRHTPLQAKEIVNTARPDQRIIRQIAFPAAGMVKAKIAYMFGRKEVRHD
jgi:hypothetical protein